MELKYKMTINDYKKQLSELHEKIKNNPFRQDYELYSRYGKGYFDTVYKFAEMFYHLIKDIRDNILQDISDEDKKLAQVAKGCLFTHDFFAAINRSNNALYSYINGKNDRINIIHKEEELIELCITCIHCYIDTGILNRFPFRYKGFITWAEWDDEKNDYVIDFSRR